jgi:hypothetical protein
LDNQYYAVSELGTSNIATYQLLLQFIYMLPNELQQLFDEKDLDDIDIKILSAEFKPYSATIKILFNPDTYYFEGEVLVPQTWIIKVDSLIEYRMSSEPYGNFEIVEQHPFLQKHKERHGELYIKGPVPNAYELTKALLDAHISEFGGFDFLETFMTPFRLVTVANSKSALLASGPIGIMNCYKNVLDVNGVRCNILEGNYRDYWNGEERVNTVDKLQILDMGDTFFIGENFSFTKPSLI